MLMDRKFSENLKMTNQMEKQPKHSQMDQYTKAWWAKVYSMVKAGINSRQMDQSTQACG
jgi:hypothetical protein